MKINFVFSLFLVIMTLFGCESKSTSTINVKESESQINRYYDNLDNPLDYNLSVTTLYSNNKSTTSISALGSYLISKGYSVKKVDTPKHILDDNNLSEYEVAIEISYPRDYKTILTQPFFTFEKVWINNKTRKIELIETTDPLISSRSFNYKIIE